MVTVTSLDRIDSLYCTKLAEAEQAVLRNKWLDILIEPEQIVGIVAGFQCRESPILLFAAFCHLS